jgi:hypothetical protein
LQKYWESQVVSRVTMYVASAVVVLMNFGVGWLLRYMAVYEKHHSLNTEEVSMFHRSFVLKFINVGIIPLLMSSELLQSLLGLNIEASRDFNEGGKCSNMSCARKWCLPAHLFFFLNWCRVVPNERRGADDRHDFQLDRTARATTLGDAQPNEAARCSQERPRNCNHSGMLLLRSALVCLLPSTSA